MSPDRSGMVDIAELRHRLGERLDVKLPVLHEGLVVGSSRVEASDPLVVMLTLESVSGGLTATGQVRAHWHGVCRRCLDEIEGDLVTDVLETLADRPIEGESYPIRNNQVDLSDLARDAVLLDLPTAPLCSQDCAGPAAEEFPVTKEADIDLEPPRDPRWAALDVLRDHPGGLPHDPQMS